ncbi:MAG: outer membrane beta-barrel protein [Rhizobiaceae bacterium]
MLVIAPIKATYAQESGLRGTVKETPADASPLVKKKKKKKTSKLEPVVQEPVARYEPTELAPDAQSTEEAANQSDQNTANAETAPVIDTAPAARLPQRLTSSSDPAINAADQATEAAARGEADPLDRQTTASAVSQEEVPEPFNRIASAGAQQREDAGRTEAQNSRTGAIEGRAQTDEDDPYAAPGITAGAFILRPTLEQGLRWTSNAGQSATGSEAVVSETNIRLRAQSNWLRHSLNLEASGGFRKSVSGEDLNDPTFGIAADMRFDVSKDLTINGRASWDRSKESATAPALMTGPFTRPTLDTMRASLGAAYDPGLFGVTATGQVTRQAYGEALDGAGAAVSQEDRNNSFASLTLRGTYDLSPVLHPFVEVEAGRRLYDNSVDTAGYERSANRYGVRAGVAADMGEKLGGEFAAGWLIEDVDDPALKDITGIDLRGTMNWSPQRGTNVALSLATTVEGSTVAASSGSVLYSANAILTKSIRDNLEATLSAGASWRLYEYGAYQDTIFSGEAGLTWWMNRYAGINGRLRHEQTLNLDPARAFGETSVYLGVTLRR